ncbi:hypothetical protein L6452_16587 [Arctium lappa]|uniref:Uncharacterized protein n=1 Tax=Arctium lappa TaxID=4217 RepID=A0ACB9C138_ARCLA|nr:hypothetical protein L6452_16587 [Arctium lappa]
MLNSIRECATRTRGKLYFPGLLTKMLVKAGVPQYKDDLIVKEQREKWQIDMKAVTRLSNRKEKPVEAADLLTLVQDLLAQNTAVMEAMNKQRTEGLEKMEILREELIAVAKGKRKVGEGYGAERQIAVLKKMLKVRDERIKALEEENEKLIADAIVSSGAAASKDAGQPSTDSAEDH